MKSMRSQLEVMDGPARSQLTTSEGAMVIDCIIGAVSFGTPMFLPMYDSKGDIIAMSQVSENLPL